MASNNKVLTIDITNESVTIIEVSASSKKETVVHNAVIFETPEGSYEDGFIKDKETLAMAIKDQLSRNGIANKNVIFVLTSTKVVNREVMIPQVKPKNLKELIDQKAKDYFPVNIEDYVVSHSILETIPQQKQMRVMVVAAPVLMVRSYYELADMAGLKLQAIDYIGNAMLQLIKTQTSASSTTMVIQLGGESSILNIVKGDTLLLQRTVPYGTNAVVQEVMDERNVDAATAMTLLQNERLITVDFDDNAPTAAFKYLMNNIGRVMDFYASKNPDKPIDDVYLTGDGALIRGIDGLFKIQLNISTKIMDSLYNVKFDQSIDMQIYNPVYLIASIGAAFAPMNFDVPTEKSAKQKKSVSSSEVTKIMAMLATVVVIVFAAGWIVTSVMKKNAQAEQDKLNSQIASIQNIEDIISEYNDTKSKADDMQRLYDCTTSPNENLLAFIKDLEKKMPTDITIASISATSDGISFQCTCKDMNVLSKFFMQAKSISSVTNVYTTGVSKLDAKSSSTDGGSSSDDNTVKQKGYTCTMTCNFVQSQSAVSGDAATSTTAQ